MSRSATARERVSICLAGPRRGHNIDVDDDTVDLDRRDGTPFVVVTGALDYRSVDPLDDSVLEGLRTDGEIVVDLSRLTFLDSTGLSLLLRLRHVAESVRLVGTPSFATALLRTTGVESLFDRTHPAPA